MYPTDRSSAASGWKRNLDHPRLRVLDVRGRHPSSPLPHAKRAEYEREHIPGAVFVDWEHDFVATDDPVPVQVAERRRVRRARRRARDRRWRSRGDLRRLLRHLRRPRGVGVPPLRGRLARARRRLDHLEGGGPSAHPGPSEPTPAQFEPRPRPRLRRTLAEVEQARDRGATLVDARPRHLFLGEPGAPNTGHIPGARCLPYQELVDGATGLWAAPAAVARLARDAGIDPDRPPDELIATCGSGVSATVAMLALERIGVHCRRRLRRVVQRVERRSDASDRLREGNIGTGITRSA